MKPQLGVHAGLAGAGSTLACLGPEWHRN
uniref:Uncharacterized protein n=1 Tax=Anguilla anguilla TaxID=7936 RepID=A0A0E9VL16_ANGAN